MKKTVLFIILLVSCGYKAQAATWSTISEKWQTLKTQAYSYFEPATFTERFFGKFHKNEIGTSAILGLSFANIKFKKFPKLRNFDPEPMLRMGIKNEAEECLKCSWLPNCKVSQDVNNQLFKKYPGTYSALQSDSEFQSELDEMRANRNNRKNKN